MRGKDPTNEPLAKLGNPRKDAISVKGARGFHREAYH